MISKPPKLVISRMPMLLAAVVSLAAAACFPGTPTSTPEPVEVLVQPAVAAAAPTPYSPLPTAASAAPTLAPTSVPSTEVQEELTPASAPTPAPEAENGTSVESSAVFDDLALLEERAFSFLSELAVDVGVRTSGSDLEKAASRFLAQRLEELGYSPEVQEFTWDSPTASFSINTPDPANRAANTLSGTISGQATAPLVFVGLARPGDIPAEGLEGKLALIERGEITFGSKVAEVHGAGAVGAVIFNNASGSFQGTLGRRSQIPRHFLVPGRRAPA